MLTCLLMKFVITTTGYFSTCKDLIQIAYSTSKEIAVILAGTHPGCVAYIKGLFILGHHVGGRYTKFFGIHPNLG